MKIRSLTLAMFASSVLTSAAVTSVALADDDQYKISDEPLELSIQMNHKRYPVYKEDWPVEVEARKLTNIHLKDVTVGANLRTDSENTGKTEALNLMLASGKIPDIVGSSRIKDFVNQYGPCLLYTSPSPRD